MSFRADSQPLAENRRSMTMSESGGPRKRPAPIIVAKDCAAPSFKGVRALDDQHFAVAIGGPYVGSHYATEIRTLEDLVDTLVDCAAPLERVGSRLLSEGALSGGYSASTRIFDLATKKLIVELPAAHPFILSTKDIFFGRIRQHHDFQSEPLADPALSSQFPELQAIIDAGGGVLVACDLDGKVHFTIREKELAEPYAELTGLALSPDESTLLYSGYRSAGAVDLKTRKIRWVKHFDSVWHRRLAVSASGTRLAVGGSGPLRVLATADGQLVKELRTSGRIDALTFHGEVLMAAGNSKKLTLFDEIYQEREMKVAAAGINDLAVFGGGVLCACDQRQLRFVPLLDDE